MNDKNVNNNDAKFNILDYDKFTQLLLEKFSSTEPIFLSRFGGSDFDIVANELYKKKDKEFILQCINRCSNLNGYFDFETNEELKIKNFIDYCDILRDIYFRQNIYTYCCDNVINQIERNKIDNRFLQNIFSNKIPISNYSYIESIYPFLNLFKEIAENKKILIISPFSELIKEQYKNKNNLIKNYTYPNFELVTYDIPITYNDTINMSHINCKKNWIEQSIFMCHDISKIEFDIALISAGSYAMYLGDHICNIMKKKSIYLGGVLNVIFNIYGKRYDTPFFNNIVNLKYQIKNNIDINKISGGRQYKSESLLAYF